MRRAGPSAFIHTTPHGVRERSAEQTQPHRDACLLTHGRNRVDVNYAELQNFAQLCHVSACRQYSSTRLIPLPVGNFNFPFQFSNLMSNYIQLYSPECTLAENININNNKQNEDRNILINTVQLNTRYTFVNVLTKDITEDALIYLNSHK